MHLLTTGYTGEDGVELYLPAAKATEMWDAIYEAGKAEGLIPCGLGARDTLRMEAGMPLYGHEMNDEISPREAGLMFAIKLKKEKTFLGRNQWWRPVNLPLSELVSRLQAEESPVSTRTSMLTTKKSDTQLQGQNVLTLNIQLQWPEFQENTRKSALNLKSM